MPDVDAVMAAIPPLAGARVVRQFSAGPVNRSWLLTHGDSQLVLRTDGPLTGPLGLDRRGELDTLTAVSAAGIGPEPVWADPDRGWLVTRYLPGRAWRNADLHDSAQLRRLGDALRQLHALPPAGPLFEPGRIARGYARHIGTGAARKLAVDVEARARDLYTNTGPGVICHNDLVCSNIVDSRPLAFIDWEYAAVGDPLFDLAVIVCEHQLSVTETRVLLSAWSGSATPEQVSRLEAFGQLYDGLAALWRLVVEPVPQDSARGS